MPNKVPQFIGGLLEALPEMLTEERIRLGLTQKQLADKLGLKEQQIQRYESSRYQSASLRRLQEVAKALFDLGTPDTPNPHGLSKTP
jgi:HTH-type transcriptional regulator/antitoxin HigA